MESEIFRAGVTPGSPGTQDEVKMLLCYILANTGRPMSFSQLYDALSEDGLVNYFELTQVVDRLAELEHLALSQAADGSDLYCVTDLGVGAAREFERALPFTVREKALAASRRVLERTQRLREVRVVETPCEGGFLMEFSIPDRRGDIVSLKVFAPTQEECALMRRRFLNAPLTVYKGVMALLTGDEKVLGKIFTVEEPLF